MFKDEADARAVIQRYCIDKAETPIAAIAAILLGILLIALALAIDKKRPPHVFPNEFPSFASPLSLGLWVLLLMPLSEAGVYVYAPYVLQFHRDFSPMLAGYFGAIHAIAWSAAAMAVAALASRWHNAAILAGPLLLTFGLGGLAFALESGSLFIVVAAMVAIGLGFGVSNTFLAQRVMALAKPGAEDRSAAAIPTLEGLGAALSAALAGIAGNHLGLAGELTPLVVARADLALFGGGALIALLAVLLAWRMIRA